MFYVLGSTLSGTKKGAGGLPGNSAQLISELPTATKVMWIRISLLGSEAATQTRLAHRSSLVCCECCEKPDVRSTRRATPERGNRCQPITGLAGSLSPGRGHRPSNLCSSAGNIYRRGRRLPANPLVRPDGPINNGSCGAHAILQTLNPVQFSIGYKTAARSATGPGALTNCHWAIGLCLALCGNRSETIPATKDGNE
jgi:hypothetical protein